MPIIKKWLYSDKDIFARELASNCNDALSKLKRLVDMGEAKVPESTEFRIDITVNADDKTIRFIDNGIGMTGEEVKKYINQIAFSGAQDFIDKYKDKMDEASQIIGHFGLGFYSAFMVSEKIEINTLSYLPGSEAVKWIGEGAATYEMESSDRTERGTEVILHVSEDGMEFLDEGKMREVLLKYCYFMPFDIYLDDVSAKAAKQKKKDAKKHSGQSGGHDHHDHDEDESEADATDDGALHPLNDKHPLWLKNPKDCTEDEYKAFYRKVFNDYSDPLFWIHLNMDYPFNLKGILYFPKLKHEFETMEGQIKLYYNQVFVANNIKEVIPEFLLLLKGTIDCPDLPLNVSRSFLQNDGYVSKLSAHITKKVADKLTSLYENERDNYNKYWDDINPFVKYGCIKEPKFYEKVKDIIIYKTTDGSYATLKEYLERNKERHKDKVFYVTDEKQQAQYVKLFRENGMEAVILPSLIDTHFMQFLEYKEGGISFTRIDSDISEGLKDMDEVAEPDKAKEDAAALETMFKEVLADDKLKIQVERLKATDVPAILTLSEYSRRMKDMSRAFGDMDMKSAFPEEKTLVLNSSNSLVHTLLDLNANPDKKEDAKLICRHLYDLALLSQRQLEPEDMAAFIERSRSILSRLALEDTGEKS